MTKKIIIITGASQGIGAELVKAFAKLNNVVLLLLARTESKLKKLVADCQQHNIEAHYFLCDLTNEAMVKSTAEKILSKWPSPDVLINNAGSYSPSSFIETSAEEFKAQIDVNLTSAFLVTQAFLPAMLVKKLGDIFFIGSIASLQSHPDSPAYCASKHGLLGLARTLREMTKTKGIRVTSILPGAVLTPAWDGVDLSDKQLIPAKDIAKTIVDVYQLDRNTNIEEILVRPQRGDFG